MSSVFTAAPLAVQVAQHIGDKLLKTLKPGAGLPPVRVLAAALGVSVPTLRAAQKILARQGWVEICHGKGVYAVAGGAARRIGIVSELNLLRPGVSRFFAATVCELTDFFAGQGIETEFFMGESLPAAHLQKPSCGRFIREVEAGRLDGAVLVSAPETGFWRRFIDGCPIPLVGAGTDYHAGTDYRELVRKGLQALAAQGGTRVAALGGPFGANVAEAELRDMAQGFGLEMQAGWTRHDLHPQLRGAGWEEFREIWTVHRDKPDALLVTDDVLFADAQIAVLELGLRVPEQLRIATHANAGAEPRPPFPVTLLRVDAVWCANQLGDMLIRRMNGEAVEPGLRTVPIEVVEVEPGVPHGSVWKAEGELAQRR